MTADNRTDPLIPVPPHPAAERQRPISYAEVLRRVAKRHDFEVANFEALTVTGQILLEDAAALRELARLVEEAEQIHAYLDAVADDDANALAQWDERTTALIASLAAGFSVPSPGAGPEER